MEITYDVLLEYLKLGEEIEFEYKNKKYSINCGQNAWYLTEFYNINQEFNSTDELLEFGKIEGKTIKEIWDDIDIIAIY